MEAIDFESVGILGRLTANKYTLQKILDDKFTKHYIPDFRIASGGTTPCIEVVEREQEKKAILDYPRGFLKPHIEHRSFVVTAEYLAERARQEKLGLFALNSAAAERNGDGVLFYGEASNLGKSTFATTLSENGFNQFSDEKTLLDLEHNLMVSGSRSIPLRKNVWKERFPNDGEYRELDTKEQAVSPKVSLIISPHYDHGLDKPIITALDPLDLFWGLLAAISKRIRGVTRFIDDFTFQLPSIDTEELSEKRIELMRKFSRAVKGFYFQGNHHQLVTFVKSALKLE